MLCQMLLEVFIAQPVAQATFTTSPILFLALITSANLLLVLQNCVADPPTVAIFFGMRRSCFPCMLILDSQIFLLIHASTTTDPLVVN